MSKRGLKISKHNLIQIYGRARTDAFTVETIQSAWRKTGIHPFNPKAIPTAAFAPALNTTTKSALPIPRNATAAETRAYIQDLQARLEMANGRIDSFHTRLVLADDENGRIREQLHQESRLLLKVQKNADRMFEVHPEILEAEKEAQKRRKEEEKSATKGVEQAAKDAGDAKKAAERARKEFDKGVDKYEKAAEKVTKLEEKEGKAVEKLLAAQAAASNIEKGDTSTAKAKKALERAKLAIEKADSEVSKTVAEVEKARAALMVLLEETRVLRQHMDLANEKDEVAHDNAERVADELRQRGAAPVVADATYTRRNLLLRPVFLHHHHHIPSNRTRSPQLCPHPSEVEMSSAMSRSCSYIDPELL